MRCISCGLPLSPSRTNTNCPRCGTPISSDQKATSTPVPQQYQQANWGNAGVVEAGDGTPLPHTPEFRPGVPQQIPPQTPQQVSPPGQMWLRGPVSQPGLSPGTPQQFTPPLNSRKTKLGFAVAGLCVLAGGLILAFVYLLAIGSPGSSSNNTATTNNTANVSTPTTAPTTAATLSPTATAYPGQQYIDNAQMASAVDPNSLQPAQLATTFKTNQKIYVTFHLHPPGHSGAFCVLWYLNGKQIANFSLAVNANSKLSYAYSIYGGTGAAYVEIYWASTTLCSDQLLAQHVDFTVTT
jgi:predicted RNA-binding Zn-ribbon protein involved in translation (DUF1610 family)